MTNGLKESIRGYVGTRKDQDAPFHPNRISFYGAVASGVGFGCLASPITAPASLFFLGVGFGCDVADGAVARSFDLTSQEGAKLDPLFDKVKNFGFVGTAGLLGSLSNPYLAVGSALSLGVDYISQRQRGNITNQFDEAYDVVVDPNGSTLDEIKSENNLESIIVENKSKNLKANWFGKIKTGLQTGVHIGYASMFVFEDSLKEHLNLDSNTIETGLGIALATSAVCGSVGVYERLKKSKGNYFPD